MEERHSVVTPESISFSYDIAGIGSRFMAALADFLIYVMIALGVSVLYRQIDQRITNAALSSALEAVYISFTFLLYWGYYILFELIWGGQSPGKRLIGLRVVRLDGAPAAPGQIVIRNILRLVDFFPAFYTTGLVTMFVNPQSRRLGDLAAGTLVVREGRRLSLEEIAPSAGQTQEREQTDEATNLPIHRLDREQRAIAREFIARRGNMSADQRARLAMQIAGALAQQMNMPAPSTVTEAEQLLRLAAALSN